MDHLHTMNVAELIAALQRMPQDLPVEILNHHTDSLSWVDGVELFDDTWDSYMIEEGDYPCVVIHTESWASE